jgi:23S rRNA (uracil1939-C5)-methyltransferase
MQIYIEKLIYGGAGLGRGDDGRPVFVKKTVPDDLVEVEIKQDKRSYCLAETKEILRASNDRINPKCPSFGHCGGCEHQNMSYQSQLLAKETIFEEVLARADIETEILPIIPGGEAEFFYRNTIRYFFAKFAGRICLSMHDAEDFRKLIKVENCLLQSEIGNEIAAKLLALFNTFEEDFADNLSQLRIREGKHTGEIMIELVTKTDQLPHKEEIKAVLLAFSNIKSAYHTISQKDSLYDAKRKLIFGSPIIHEKIGKHTFQISPESFFQTNSLGIKTLYDTIKQFADIRAGDSVIDLFCGTGTIGIYLSTLAKEVIGVESIQSAINDAKANAKLNKVINAEFICADATKWLNKATMQQCNNATIILDPPREGLNKELINKLSTVKCKQLIYVSCNPSTFARDIKEFEIHGLKLKKVQPVDMFPQTHHLECVGLISR